MNPKRKTELYRRCLDALLRDWDAERGFRRDTAYEAMSDDRKERLFEHIGGKFFLDQESYEFKRAELLVVVDDFLSRLDILQIEPATLMGEIERHHGIIEQLSQDHFCFSHTSMQDYFVARHLLSRRIELDSISKNIENENWFPVIEFVIALAEDPKPILDLLIKRSDMSGLSNFPPMARRTKILTLLHRGMASSPFISKEMSKKCFEHLVQSQVQMAQIFRAGKVVPLPEFGSFGVRHLMLFMERPRPTLGAALQPFRKFANQIVATPMDGYAKACFAVADQLAGPIAGKKFSILDDALLLNLIIPLGAGWPTEVSNRLKKISERPHPDYLKNLIARSQEFVDGLVEKG
jgi:hypothetical protein